MWNIKFSFVKLHCHMAGCTKDFSVSAKVRIGFLSLNHAHYYCLMTVALFIVTPVITSGLGCTVQSECLALSRAIAVSYGMGKITHYIFAHKFVRVEKHIV